jgi:hypothetical protein
LGGDLATQNDCAFLKSGIRNQKRKEGAAQMKKLTIALMLVLLVVTLGACKKEQEATDTVVTDTVATDTAVVQTETTATTTMSQETSTDATTSTVSGTDTSATGTTDTSMTGTASTTTT